MIRARKYHKPLSYNFDDVLFAIANQKKPRKRTIYAKSPIKWPGGKAEEFQYIKHLIPEFDRYIEPFFGGGAIFFKLQPDKAIINDVSKELMNFYRFLKDEYDRNEFKKNLYEYVVNWEKIPKYISLFENEFVKLYQDYRKGNIDLETVKKIIPTYIEKKEEQFNGLFLKKFCLNEKNLSDHIIKNLISKTKRIKEVEAERGKLSLIDLKDSITTAFRSGFYMHFRDIMNFDDEYKLSLEKKIANYYFIREFCYGSMFRFNASGYFNIPYGGNTYNKKDFRKKVDAMFTDEFKSLFANTIIKDGDFEKIFESYKLTDKDFIFVDPPYDSDFSTYNNYKFEKEDHIRLAKCLQNTQAKFILIIKRTDFISELYNNKKGIKIEDFDKQYLYNMKGRNNQKATHLIIYNYDI